MEGAAQPQWFLRSISEEENHRFENWHLLFRTVREAAEALGTGLAPLPPFYEERKRDDSFRLDRWLRFEHPRLVFEAYEEALTTQLRSIETARSSWTGGKAIAGVLARIRDEFAGLPEAVRLRAPFRTFFHLLPAFRGSALGQIPLFVYHPLRLTEQTLVLALPGAFPEYFEAALTGFLRPLEHPLAMTRTAAEYFIRLEVQA